MLLGHAGVEWLKGMCLHVGTATVPAAPGSTDEPGHLCKTPVRVLLGVGSCSERSQSPPSALGFPFVGVSDLPRFLAAPRMLMSNAGDSGLGRPALPDLGRSRNPEFGFPRLFSHCITQRAPCLA